MDGEYGRDGEQWRIGKGLVGLKPPPKSGETPNRMGFVAQC